MKCYPEIKEKEEMRKIIGRYGLTGKQQVRFVLEVLILKLLIACVEVDSTKDFNIVLTCLLFTGEPH